MQLKNLSYVRILSISLISTKTTIGIDINWIHQILFEKVDINLSYGPFA